MTAEEAGRKAAKLASEAIEQKNRLQQLLRAVDHVVDYDDNCDNDDSSGNSNTSMATLLSHAGIEVCRGGTSSSSNGAGLRENVPMSPPLHTATTYTRPADGIYKDGDSIYARMDNPTRLLLERCVFELECSHQMFSTETNIAGNIPTTTSFAFSSGMQAVTAILLAHSTSSAVPNNMTVLIPTDVYHGVRTLLSDVFSRHGVQVRELNMVTTRNNGSESDNDAGVVAIEKAISDIATAAAIEKNGKCGVGGNQTNGETNNRHNVIVWMETPSNPKCEVADIKAICEAARSAADLWSNVVDLTTVVDGTMASPVLTRPLELGADISFHSGTKYLAGHSDALIGTVTLSPITSRGRVLGPLIRSVQIASGGVASPWDSWLTLRGMRTLHIRVERQCKTAMKLAEYLHEKMQLAAARADPDLTPKVAVVQAVHYPGLLSHPHHQVATRQMSLATATAKTRTDTDNNSGTASGSYCYGGVLSFELSDEVEAMAFAGAVKIAQRATSLGGTETLIEHRASIEPPENIVSPLGLLRVSVGLEDPDDLIRDFDSAFTIVEQVVSGGGYSGSSA